MKKVVQPILDYVAYFVVRVVICIVQALPIETCQTICQLLAWVATDIIPNRRAVIDDNLLHVFPHHTAQQRHEIKRRMWEHLFLIGCEVAHAPRKIHDTNWRNYIRLRNDRELVRQLLGQRSTILVSGHFGNFEIGNMLVGLLGLPSYSVARDLDNPHLHKYINQFRSMYGQFMFSKTGSAPLVARVLETGGTIALLADQQAGEKGCWVEFLGRLASCHKAVAIFTISGGATMMVGYARRVGRPLQFEMGLEGSADPLLNGPECANVTALTKWYNRMLERIILKAPEQYWWLHRRWRTPPERVQRRLAA